jgi:hypothetical protein
MLRSRLPRALAGAAFLSLAIASSSAAQTPAPAYQLQPSGRATTVVELAARAPQGTPAAQRPAPKRITIDYGQPHLRGRDVAPLMTPDKGPWRLGANTSTSLVSDVDLTIGDKDVPKGSYTLWVQRKGDAAELVVNKQTGQWGTAHDAAHDLVRIPLRVRTISGPLDALQVVLVPTGGSTKGVLRIVWGTVEMEADWTAKP